MSELRDDLIRANTRRADAEAYQLELSNQLSEKEVAYDNASMQANRVFALYNTIRKDSVAECIFQLNNWFRQNPTLPMLIELYSPGGEVFAGFALYDTIKSLRNRGATINVKSTGYTASMAAILLQAGSERIITPNSFIMLHEVSTLAEGSLAELKDQTKFSERLQAKAEDVLLDRSNLTRAQLRGRINRKDSWLDAAEALKLGLIDRIEE